MDGVLEALQNLLATLDVCVFGNNSAQPIEIHRNTQVFRTFAVVSLEQKIGESLYAIFRTRKHWMGEEALFLQLLPPWYPSFLYLK